MPEQWTVAQYHGEQLFARTGLFDTEAEAEMLKPWVMEWDTGYATKIVVEPYRLLTPSSEGAT